MPEAAAVALFDLDDTLIDREAAFRRWAQWFCGERGLDPAAVAALCVADGFGYTPRDEMFAMVGSQFDLGKGVDELVAGYRSQYLSFFEEEPDVQAALVRLRNDGWRVGVVTNGPATQVEKVGAGQARALGRRGVCLGGGGVVEARPRHFRRDAAPPRRVGPTTGQPSS